MNSVCYGQNESQGRNRDRNHMTAAIAGGAAGACLAPAIARSMAPAALHGGARVLAGVAGLGAGSLGAGLLAVAAIPLGCALAGYGISKLMSND